MRHKNKNVGRQSMSFTVLICFDLDERPLDSPQVIICQACVHVYPADAVYRRSDDCRCFIAHVCSRQLPVKILVLHLPSIDCNILIARCFVLMKALLTQMVTVRACLVKLGVRPILAGMIDCLMTEIVMQGAPFSHCKPRK
jgi:hypothetical protein